MLKRLYFPLITLFWVIMNVLLWRSEMSARKDAGSPIPATAVWDRMLTAPDDSSLQLIHRGRRLGFCRWVPNIDEAVATGKTTLDGQELEGRVQQLAGYTLDLDGNVLLGETGQRLRFFWHAEFHPDGTWRAMTLRLNLKPQAWEFQAEAATETLRVRAGDRATGWERAFTFAELQRPETLLGLFAGPGAAAWLSGWARGAGLGAVPAPLGLGLEWEARSDWLTVAHSRLRVYRLRARLFDRHELVVTVSRVGEILRVELPDQLVLVNEALLTL
ncbi:MAG: hypothetical protein FJ387_08010 [Verrucomicrobia bacterium]|nr:hypothetical protein [Verrucomicrobiota bacterium]